jgi:hypothetical protein
MCTHIPCVIIYFAYCRLVVEVENTEMEKHRGGDFSGNVLNSCNTLVIALICSGTTSVGPTTGRVASLCQVWQERLGSVTSTCQ